MPKSGRLLIKPRIVQTEFTEAMKKKNMARNFEHYIGRELNKVVKKIEMDMKVAMTTGDEPTDSTISADWGAPITKTIGHTPTHDLARASNWKNHRMNLQIGAIKGDQFWRKVVRVHNDGDVIRPTEAQKLAIPLQGGPAEFAFTGRGQSRRRTSVKEVMSQWKSSFVTTRSLSYSRGPGINIGVYRRTMEVNIPPRGIISKQLNKIPAHIQAMDLTEITRKALRIGMRVGKN